MAEPITLCRDADVTLTYEAVYYDRHVGMKHSARRETTVSETKCATGEDREEVLQRLNNIVNGFCRGEGTGYERTYSTTCAVTNEYDSYVYYVAPGEL